MKRAIVLLFVTVFLVSGIVARSEVIEEEFKRDISGLSTDSMMIMKKVIDEALGAKGLLSGDINEGVYTAGINVFPGRYEFTAHETDADGEYVWIYTALFEDLEDPEDVWDEDPIDERVLTEEGEKSSFVLDEGDVLLITTSGGSCTFNYFAR